MTEQDEADLPDDQRTTQAGPIRGHPRSRGAGPADVLLAGRYRLLRQIGRGGMGEVFEALDTRHNPQTVAIKRMFADDAQSIARLKREYRRMEGIAHPNLISLHGLDVHENRPFIVMEYIKGTEFYAALGRKDGAPLDEDHLRKLLRMLAHGVMALHDAGRIHRDLKGRNVMVTEQGRVVVLDFGLVNEVQRRTLITSTMGTAVGTPHYMAPEQAAGEASTPASDWYALGVMLHVAATQQYPIEGTSFEVLLNKQSADIPRVRTRDPRISPALEDLIAHLLCCGVAERATGYDVLHWCDRATRPIPRSPPPPGPAALIGRDTHLLALSGALARASRQLVRIDVTGPSGTGKSALLRQFIAPLRRDASFVILESKCYEHDHVPLKAFDPLIDRLCHYLLKLPRDQVDPMLDGGFHALTHLFPALRKVRSSNGADSMLRRLGLVNEENGEHDLRERAIRGLRGLLYRIAASARLVLAIDDLQWADLDSVQLLQELVTDSALAALFIYSYSEEEIERAPPLQRLVGPASAPWQGPRVVVRTGALPREGAIMLAQRMLGPAGSRRRAERVATEAQGNPMLIEAIVRYLGEEADPRETPPGERLSLEGLLTGRLATLDPEASRMLSAIAVVGQPETFDMITQVAGITGDARKTGGQLRAAHLVRTTEIEGIARVECYHPKIAKAALARLSHHELALAHHSIATALATAGSEDFDRLAYHWFSAGERDRAGTAACEAANLAVRTCFFDRAVRLYRLAQICNPQDASLRRRLAEALVAAGRVGEAAPLLLEVASTANAKSARSLRLLAGDLWLVCGELAKGIEVLRPLLADHAIVYPQQDGLADEQFRGQLAALVRRGLSWTERSTMELSSRDVERYELYWTLSRGHVLTDLTRSGLFGLRAVRLALDLGEPRRIARSLALVGAVAVECGDPNGRGWLAEAEVMAHRIHDHSAASFVALCWGLVDCAAGAWARAVEDLEFGLARLPVSAVWEQNLVTTSLLSSLEALGEMATLAERSRRNAFIAEGIGQWRIQCLGLAYGATAALAADDVAGCRALLQNCSERLRGKAYEIVHFHALKVAIDCDLYIGDPVKAWRRIDAEWNYIVDSKVFRTRAHRSMAFLLRARAGLALCAYGAADFDFVEKIVEEDVGLLEREPGNSARAHAALLRAGLAGRRGDPREVMRLLWTAVGEFDSAGMVLYATCGRRCVGSWGSRPEEAALRETSERFLRLKGVVRPERWTAVLAPALAQDANARRPPPGR